MLNRICYLTMKKRLTKKSYFMLGHVRLKCFNIWNNMSYKMSYEGAYNITPMLKCVFPFVHNCLCPIVVCDWWGIGEGLVSRWVLGRNIARVVIKWVDCKLVCLLQVLWIDIIIMDLSLAWYAPRVWEFLRTGLTIMVCYLFFSILFYMFILFPCLLCSDHIS